MSQDILQSTTIRVPLKAYLTSDHVTAATGKTLATVISRNMAAFGNPSAGATNATEVASGWYYADLSTTDTATLGPLIVRATAALTDDVEVVYNVVKATNRGMTGIPDAAAGANGGLPTGDASGRVTGAANLLDAIAVTDPGAPASQTTLSKMMVALWRKAYKKSTLTATQLKVYADDGSTANATSTVSDDGTTQTVGAAS